METIFKRPLGLEGMEGQHGGVVQRARSLGENLRPSTNRLWGFRQVLPHWGPLFPGPGKEGLGTAAVTQSGQENERAVEHGTWEKPAQ